MSVWGKLIGGAAGYVLGGPIGALVGALAGHIADRVRDSGAGPREGDPTASITFTIGVIVLSAKMARADGAVSADEAAVFRSLFRVPPGEQGHVDRIFRLAQQDAGGFEPYARQLAEILRDRPGVLEELLDCLFMIALADGHVQESELAYLRKVAEIFGFSAADFRRIREGHLGPDRSDPYTILGLDPGASDHEVRQAWRRLIKIHHPDRLVAAGAPLEFVDVATAKLAAINVAHDRIMAERNGRARSRAARER